MDSPVSTLDVITVRVEFDAITLSASFLTEQGAAEWIVETLQGLLAQYPITRSTRINVARST